MSELEKLIKELPSELHQEAEDFIRFIIERRGRKPKCKLELDWISALEAQNGDSSIEEQRSYQVTR